MAESKHDRFRRLAQLRGERTLNDLRLLANLSNKNNYEYTETEVKNLFVAIDEELRIAKYRFVSKKKRGLKL